MGAFASRAFFSKSFQPIPQEGASATGALSTNGIHQGPCLKVLQVQMARSCKWPDAREAANGQTCACHVALSPKLMYSTCIKDAGIAIRHWRGYTFFYTAGSRNGLKAVGSRGYAHTKRKLYPRRRHVFVLEKYVEDVGQHQKIVPVYWNRS